MKDFSGEFLSPTELRFWIIGFLRDSSNKRAHGNDESTRPSHEAPAPLRPTESRIAVRPGALSAPPPSARGLVTALGIAQICAWGSLYYSFPLIAEAMGAEQGWSKPQLYGAATLGLLLSGLAAYPIGAAIDAGRGRLVMTAASLGAGLLLIAWSRIESLAAFYLIFAGIGCLHAATLYEPAFAVMARRVGPENARRAITSVTLWGGFASTVFIPLIQVLLDNVGWRGALVALGLVNILVCAALHWVFIDPARDHVPPFVAEAPPPLKGRQALAAAMRRPVYWALMVAFVAYFATFSALTFHLYPLLLERGLGAASVVAVMMVIGPAQVAGRILIMVFASGWTIRAIGAAVVAAFPFAVAGFWLLPADMLLLGLMAGLYGAANGVMTIVRGLAIPEMVSRDAYGALNGAITAPSQVAKALAPLAAAALWATGSSYGPVVLAMFAGSLLFCAGFWLAAWIGRRS